MSNNSRHSVDERILKYIEVARQLERGEFNLKIPASSPDQVGILGRALQDLAYTLKMRYVETQKLNQITSNINAGLLLDDILEIIYLDFRDIIPYDRIGFSLIEDSEGQKIVRAYWAKSDLPAVKLTKGYAAPLAGSSLETIIKTGQPRILNNLVDYLRHKPQSASTRTIVEEGIRSSLTCPLVTNGIPVGFIFFSSVRPNTYIDVHIDIFRQVAGHLSVILEKGRLVSELTAQKQRIEAQNQELRHLDDLKNTFLGIAAHDLRGPIGNIKMIADLLADGNAMVSAAEGTSLVNDIGRQANYMLQLLNDLLDITRIESGKLELNLESINMVDFLAETVKRQSTLASVKNMTITLKPAPAGLLRADPIRLRQVFDNLLSNAIKYSPLGSNIEVSVTCVASGRRFAVKDRGPGITKKDRTRLFQHFARLSAKPTGGEKSVGLGLAITRRIVEAHGGHIDVDSEPGQGATFWFVLPVSPVNVAAAAEQSRF